MKKITNRLFCALILLCAFGVFVGCQQEPETKPGPSITSPSIVGTWICNEDNPVAQNIVFNDSGAVSGYIQGERYWTGTYSVSGNKAQISGVIYDYDDEGNAFYFQLSAKFGETTLTLTDGEVSLVFTRL